MLGVTGEEQPLGLLHALPPGDPVATAPMLRRAQIQARVGQSVSKAERKRARTHAWDFERTAEWRAFVVLYERLIVEWVIPQLGDVPVLYQRKPILRVVLPGSVPPTAMHCDADYFHNENEL